MLAPFTTRLARHRGLAIWLTVVVAVSGVSWWSGSRVSSPAQVAAEAEAPPATPITADVQRRVLEQRLALRGTVRPRHEERVGIDPSAVRGRPVVTELPVRADDEVRNGMLLAEVAGRPVFALHGEKPAYRTLHEGMAGEDVAQLQRALSQLGYDTGGHDGVFGPKTAAAVRQLYAEHGYAAPERSPEPSGSPAAPAPEETPDGSVVQEPEPDPLVTVPLGEVAYLSDFPARVSEVSTEVGDEVDGPLLTVATGGLVVEVPVTAGEKDKVARGGAARVTSRTLGVEATGKVTRIARREQDGGEDRPAVADGTGSVPVPVPVRDEPATGYIAYVESEKTLESELRGREVRVSVRLASTEGRVLVVPLAAVWSKPSGRSYVSVPGGDGDTRDVAVRVGMSAGGYAELTWAGGTLRPGDPVVVGKERRG